MAVQGRRPGDEHADRLNEYYEDTWFDDRFLWLDPRNRALHFGYEQPGETLIGDLRVRSFLRRRIDQDVKMPSPPAVPQFGALLRSHIASVPDAARPAFLSGLERSAAARYREWADAAPEHADVLLECAAREDEIAELVAALFPIDAHMQRAVDDALPAAVAVYYDVFAPYSVLDQLYLQSEAELQGAQAWVGIAAATDDPAARDVLARCTALETESAEAVKELLAAAGA